MQYRTVKEELEKLTEAKLKQWNTHASKQPTITLYRLKSGRIFLRISYPFSGSWKSINSHLDLSL